jgi:hypothetical protein
MPDPRGRRRGRQSERARKSRADTAPAADTKGPPAGAGGEVPPSEPPAMTARRVRRPMPAGATPSPTARATGMMLAVVTAFLAGLLIKDSGGSVTAIIAGVLLILLAVVVAVLVAAPGRVRTLLRR